MIRELDINSLVDSVKNLQDEKQQRKIENIRKRYEWLQSYSKENEVTNVERIEVKPRLVTTTYTTEHKKMWKCGNSKSIECGTELREHEVKERVVTDEDIITTLKAIHPDHVENTLYWFNNGNYLFTTDKDQVYNLRRIPRPLTDEEKQEISNIVKDIEEKKAEIEPLLHEARLLQAYIIPSEQRTKEQNDMANSGECVMLLLGMCSEFEKERRSKRYIHGEDFDRNMYGETVEEAVIRRRLNEASIANKEHKKAAAEALTKIDEYTTKCNEEPLYFIHRMKQNNQIKIYIGNSMKTKYENLGYTVYSVDREEKDKRMTTNNGLIVEEEKEYTKTSHYFQMNLKAFKTSCIHGKVCRKGYYFDCGNEVELKTRPTEKVTITDECGNVRTFSSKSEAAKELKVSQSLISKVSKNGGVINTTNKIHSSKSVTLVREDNTVIKCASMAILAKELNTNKMKVSRTLKGKTVGDKVTLNGVSYTIQD